MKKFELTPFSKPEGKIPYEMNSFEELNKPFTVLIHKDVDDIPLSNNYRFGVHNKDGYFWFFEGKATTSDRFIAIDVFVELLAYCENHNIGQPFAYKEFEKREQN